MQKRTHMCKLQNVHKRVEEPSELQEALLNAEDPGRCKESCWSSQITVSGVHLEGSGALESLAVEPVRGVSMEAEHHPDEGRYWMWMNSVLSGWHGTVGTTQSWSLRDSEVFSLCSHTTAGGRMANQIDGALILVSGVLPFMVSRWGCCPFCCSGAHVFIPSLLWLSL